MAARRDGGMPRHKGRDHRQDRRQGDRQQDEARPDERGGQRQGPARQQRDERRRRRQGAPQIVEHLPEADRRDGAGGFLRQAALHAAEQPRQQLPVAARPAMLACRGDVVAGGKLLDHLDVGGQARAGEDAFEEIVAQHRVVGHAAAQRGLEGVDVVDALAGVGALAEQVLVDVRHRRRIGIDAAAAGEDALEQRAFHADRQGRRDARLQHAVAFDDPVPGGVETRPVERMRHLADQALDRVARQSRVGVERDDVADVGRQRPRSPSSRNVVSVAPRSRRLSSCSLPRLRSQPIQRPCASFQTRRRCSRRKRSAPSAVGWRLLSRAMPSTAAASRSASPGVGLRVGVGPVRQQREMDGAAGIGEIVDLQPLDCSSTDARVDSSVGMATRVRSCGGTPSRSSRPGSSVAPKPPVIARLTSSNAASIAGRRPIRTITAQLPAGEADLRQHEQRQEENDRGREGDAGDIARDARGARSVAASARPDGRKPHGPLEGGPAAADQMIARIALPLIAVQCRATTRRPRARRARSPTSASSVPRASCSMAVR